MSVRSSPDSRLQDACPATSAFIEHFARSMTDFDLSRLETLTAPISSKRRNPATSQKRLKHLARSALRHYAPEALRCAGATAAAAAILHEPDDTRTAHIAQDMAKAQFKVSSAMPKGRRRSAYADAALTCQYAADALLSLKAGDTTRETAENTAKTLRHWAGATGSSTWRALHKLIPELVNPA